MADRQHRRSVPDRARRRAIRALAARLGVSYSVAKRLLAAQPGEQFDGVSGGLRRGGPGGVPAGADEHREWLFAVREHRSFDLRVRDTRLAADIPLGRAAHLVDRFPPLRHAPETGPLYDGDGRQLMVGLLYAVLAAESPALVPPPDELAWVAELGEEVAVDVSCAALDRAARLLLDEDRWHLWTRVETALAAGEASTDRSVRDAAITLGREFRTTVLRRSVDGARQTLDALLVIAHDGHPPGTWVRTASGPAVVVGARWRRTGPPTHYEIRSGGVTTVVAADDVGPLDQPTRPEPVLA